MDNNRKIEPVLFIKHEETETGVSLNLDNIKIHFEEEKEINFIIQMLKQCRRVLRHKNNSHLKV